jgi:hypothetical protein
MALHSEATVGNVHIIYNWTYANAAARTGATGLVAGDVGKFCRQLDDNTIWMLTDDDPVTWFGLQGLTNPMTAVGDIIVGIADGAPDNLAAGSEGDVLTIASGVPAWAPAAGGGFSTGDIQQVELFRSTLAEAGNFDFSSIPATYDHLIINILAISSVAAGNDIVVIYFNNDTTNSNYTRESIYANGETLSSAEVADTQIGYIKAANGGTGGQVGQILGNILNYAGSTFRKMIITKYGCFDTTANQTGQRAVTWHATPAAINRITIQPDGYATDKFAAGSFCQIIGVKTVA